MQPVPAIQFALDAPLYILPMVAIQSIIRAVGITPLPNAPQKVLGIINMHGLILPVLDMRFIFGLPPKQLASTDKFLIADTPKRTVALAVNDVVGMREIPEAAITDPAEILPFAGHLKGVARLEDGLALIYDLNGLLSLDEERQLDTALEEGTG